MLLLLSRIKAVVDIPGPVRALLVVVVAGMAQFSRRRCSYLHMLFLKYNAFDGKPPPLRQRPVVLPPTTGQDDR